MKLAVMERGVANHNTLAKQPEHISYFQRRDFIKTGTKQSI